MREEESGHRPVSSSFIVRNREHIPLIRPPDLRGLSSASHLLVKPLGLDAVRKQASAMEFETRQFYEKSAARTHDASIRNLTDSLPSNALNETGLEELKSE